MSPEATADDRFMSRALELAEMGWGQTSPNPLVGALVVQHGHPVGEGFHEQYGGRHAEIVALEAAGARARGATMYVTLEPCVHQGKTPPCVDAILAAGVRRVVVAARDPNPKASGGLSRLESAGVDVVVGPGEAAAREQNAAFFHSFSSDRPWTTLKLAVSLDGAIADASSQPGWLTSELARRAVHQMRAGSDAVAVGMRTVLADDPQLTVREVAAPRIPPVRVVFSRAGRLPLTSRLAQSVHEAPVLVLAETIDSAYEHLLQQQGVEVVAAPTLEDGVRFLTQRGVQSLLVEGGAHLATALLLRHLVDRLVIIQAPIILGSGGLSAFEGMPSTRIAEAPRLRVIRREEIGGDLLTVFDVGAR